jgi:ElaB/YqjD/DUF883 family membrane-anchored ribosome-binding protein
MDQEPDVIRQQIEETRSSLTEKLETLENQVRGTVETAKSTVEDTLGTAKATVEQTIEAVRSTVQDTVESVKRTVNVEYQVDRHPWAMLGGSVVAGFVVGSFLGKGTFRQAGQAFRHAAGSMAQSFSSVPPTPEAPSGNGYGAAAPQPAHPGLLDRLQHEFHDEIQEVKGLAIGAAMGVLRDLVKQSVPQMAEQVDHLMNSMTAKLGGKPMQQNMMDMAGGTSTRTPDGRSSFSGRTM